MISALELLGTIISVKLFLNEDPDQGHWAGKVSAGGSTDNQGKRFVVNRFMTTKFPLLAFVCELASVLEEKSCLVDLGWVPRDQNEEADAITNGDVGNFNQAKELKVQWDFRVLDEMLDLGDKFYSDVQKEKEEEMERPEVKRPNRKKVGLKVTDPW